jgi:hypothetical protein
VSVFPKGDASCSIVARWSLREVPAAEDDRCPHDSIELKALSPGNRDGAAACQRESLVTSGAAASPEERGCSRGRRCQNVHVQRGSYCGRIRPQKGSEPLDVVLREIRFAPQCTMELAPLFGLPFRARRR